MRPAEFDEDGAVRLGGRIAFGKRYTGAGLVGLAEELERERATAQPRNRATARPSVPPVVRVDPVDVELDDVEAANDRHPAAAVDAAGVDDDEPMWMKIARAAREEG